MNWVHRTIIIPTHLADAARELGAALDPAAAGMFLTPLSNSGATPATHFISCGLVDAELAALLQDASALYQACVQGAASQAAVLTATETDAEALVNQSDMSSDEPFEALTRLNLMLIK